MTRRDHQNCRTVLWLWLDTDKYLHYVSRGKPDEASLSHKERVWPLLVMFTIFCSLVLQMKVIEYTVVALIPFYNSTKLIPASIYHSYHLTKASPAPIISAFLYPLKMISHSFPARS